MNGEGRKKGHLEDKETSEVFIRKYLEGLEGIGASIYLTSPMTEFLGGGGQGGKSDNKI